MSTNFAMIHTSLVPRLYFSASRCKECSLRRRLDSHCCTVLTYKVQRLTFLVSFQDQISAGCLGQLKIYKKQQSCNGRLHSVLLWPYAPITVIPHPPRLVVGRYYEGDLTSAACPLERAFALYDRLKRLPHHA